MSPDGWNIRAIMYSFATDNYKENDRLTTPMQQTELEITNKLGLHARAAAKVVSVASRYSAGIRLATEKQEVDGKSIMGLLMLGAGKGTVVRVSVNGPDEEQALAELRELFERRFDEEE